MTSMYVLCVDPGIVSVGLFGATLCRGKVTGVYLCDNVSILSGASSVTGIHGYIDVFMVQYKDVLGAADVLVLERQPIHSAGFPLELMFRERYGPKLVFVSPPTLHKHFGLQGYTYEGRKERAVGITTSTLTEWDERGLSGARVALDTIHGMERKHDCCDAFLFFMYYTTEVLGLKDEPEPPPPTLTPFKDFLQQFMYVKGDKQLAPPKSE